MDQDQKQTCRVFGCCALVIQPFGLVSVYYDQPPQKTDSDLLARTSSMEQHRLSAAKPTGSIATKLMTVRNSESERRAVDSGTIIIIIIWSRN